MTKAIMIQGAGSNVGKSMLVAGIARALVNRGFKVAPFKPQNMSNNAAVTMDGGEIGRAQALQALASKRPAVVDMNPVLLKPETDIGASVIVQGKRVATLKARDYGKMKSTLMPAVLESFQRLAKEVDIIIVEGAGSPAEVNLRAGDIANMGFAEAANVPVVLIGDIDRGGVIAQLVGTHAVLPSDDRDRIVGYGVNKFRGDTSLFHDGMEFIAERTKWTPLGIIPWFSDAWKLPAEDVMDVASRPGGPIKVVVPRLPRIANFDDLDPLSAEPDVSVEIIEAGHPLPLDADLVLIPGSKSTIADLAHFRAQGWDIDLKAHLRRGGRVLGICGGYQMLGKKIIDSDGIEGAPCEVEGLGLLDVETEMKPFKRLALSSGTHISSGEPIEGYEIHIGQTEGRDRDRAWISIEGRGEGAETLDGKVRGCYIHGLFAADGFRRKMLAELGAPASSVNYSQGVEDALESLAAHMERHFDIDKLLELAAEIS